MRPGRGPAVLTTLGDFLRSECQAVATCPLCGHRARLGIRALASVYGPRMKMDALLSHLKCSVCGRRGRPEITIPTGHDT